MRRRPLLPSVVLQLRGAAGAYIGLLMGLPGMAAARSAAMAGHKGRLVLPSKDLLVWEPPEAEVGVLLGVLAEPVGSSRGNRDNQHNAQNTAGTCKGVSPAGGIAAAGCTSLAQSQSALASQCVRREEKP